MRSGELFRDTGVHVTVTPVHSAQTNEGLLGAVMQQAAWRVEALDPENGARWRILGPALYDVICELAEQIEQTTPTRNAGVSEIST